MKQYFLFLFIMPSLIVSAKPTEKLAKDVLPDEISQYYQNLNLVNAFSTPSEKSRLTKFFYSNDSNQVPDSKREIFVLNLLQNIMQHEYATNYKMPNKMNASPTSSSLLHEVQYWIKSQDLISVRLRVFWLDLKDNIRMINLYDEDKDTIIMNDEIKNLAAPHYVADEIHDWIFSNSQWMKKEVRKVLVQ